MDDYLEIVRMATICTCGQTDHASREIVIKNRDLRQVVGNLYFALHAMREEGQHEYKIDIKSLADALRSQRYREGGEFALPVGQAIQEGWMNARHPRCTRIP